MACRSIIQPGWATVLVPSLLAAGACHSDPRPTETCPSMVTSSLPGVTLSFPDATCRFSLAQARAGVQLTYEVAVEQSIGDISPRSQDTGGCGAPGDSGLIVFEQIAGGGQRYCLCDTGMCEPKQPVTTLRAGHYTGSAAWDGRNWSGPSDTSNPKGSPFPAGDYEFSVSAVGTWRVQGSDQPFEVSGTMHVTLTP